MKQMKAEGRGRLGSKTLELLLSSSFRKLEAAEAEAESSSGPLVDARNGPHEGCQPAGGEGHEGGEGAQDHHQAREEAVAQGAHVRHLPPPQDPQARQGAQVPAPQRAQPQQARPLRGAQVPAHHRVRHEEDRGQQHARLHRRRARRQEEDQGGREEDVRHPDQEGQHVDQA